MTETIARPRLAALVIAIGCAMLIARPMLTELVSDPTAALVLLFLGLLVLGVLWPIDTPAPVVRESRLAVLIVGVAAFTLGRVLGGGHAPMAVSARFVVLNSLAAIAEEAFFRRFLYARLLPGGALNAIVGSALLFAVVHVTVYGAWVLPIDLAAGLVLGWQRWTSDSWSVPALTHVFANVLVVI